MIMRPSERPLQRKGTHTGLLVVNGVSSRPCTSENSIPVRGGWGGISETRYHANALCEDAAALALGRSPGALGLQRRCRRGKGIDPAIENSRGIGRLSRLGSSGLGEWL